MPCLPLQKRDDGEDPEGGKGRLIWLEVKGRTKGVGAKTGVLRSGKGRAELPAPSGLTPPENVGLRVPCY